MGVGVPVEALFLVWARCPPSWEVILKQSARVRRLVAALVAAVLVSGGFLFATIQPAAATVHVPLHGVLNVAGQYTNAASLGYNLMDVSNKSVMDTLTTGKTGLFWVGNYKSDCTWTLSDAQVTTIVNANKGDIHFSGIYFVADEPHPALCSGAPAAVASRSALIRSLDPNAKTYITVENGSSHPNEFRDFYAASAADYYGVDPYPCKVANLTSCDMTNFNARIDLALTYIPAAQIVPVFQGFGQENTASPFYRLPSVSELTAMLTVWDQKVPPSVRPFDITYGWNHQTPANPTMIDATGTTYPNLQGLMQSYFAGMTGTTVTTGPAADTYVASEYPTSNFGSQTSACASNDGTYESRMLLRFTVSVGTNGLGNARVVQSADLALTAVTNSVDTFDVRRVADQTWTESGVNWNNQPTADSTNITTLPTPSAGNTAHLNLASLVTGSGTYTIEIIGHSADSACWNTKEATANTPVLTVAAQ
jgi:hypothetical protein